MFVKYLSALIYIFIILSMPGTVLANLMQISGTWNSNWGKMVFEQTGY
jgi:hypothetical protein